ncbi:MAG: toxin [Candidatus Marinimicrobia bacterium]|nr:toxin [Candidatus Neomarinimicrobiota bacterium]
MDIIWDKEKNEWLKMNRNISFEKISELIEKENYIKVTENPSRKTQDIFIITFQNYTWIVPFVVSDKNEVVLKTAYPSRKFHKIYGGNHG